MHRLIVNQCSHGRGVITSRDIQRHAEIVRFSGAIVRRHELPLPLLPENDYYLQIGENTFLGPSGEADDYINHSCEPNAGVIVESDRSARLIALHRIRTGESIVFDYSTTMLNAPCKMKCSCGSPICRGEVTDFQFLPAAQQRKYVDIGIVPDYILMDYRRDPAA